MSEEINPDQPKDKDESAIDFGRLEQELGISSLDEDAAQMHELFKALVRAGFRERQALTLVALIISEHDVLEEAVVFKSEIDFDETDEQDPDIDFDDEE